MNNLSNKTKLVISSIIKESINANKKPLNTLIQIMYLRAIGGSLMTVFSNKKIDGETLQLLAEFIRKIQSLANAVFNKNNVFEEEKSKITFLKEKIEINMLIIMKHSLADSYINQYNNVYDGESKIKFIIENNRIESERNFAKSLSKSSNQEDYLHMADLFDIYRPQLINTFKNKIIIVNKTFVNDW